MSQQAINIGVAANDGTGDALRTAFTKTNSNFTELFALAATDPYPKVLDFASLPLAIGSGAINLVRTTTGVIGFRKLAGLWQDNAIGTWEYLGLYGRSANEIANVPGVGSSATNLQAAVDDIGGRSTDGWLEGATNLYFTAQRVLATALTGVSFVSSAVVAATDSIVIAVGKLQAQITALTSTVSGKEAAVTAGTAAQYYRGDKSFQALDKAAVGLASVDNTSDANKPVSTATQTALNTKAATSHTHASTDITDFTEASQDVLGAMVVAAGGTYNDAGNSVVFPTTPGPAGPAGTDGYPAFLTASGSFHSAVMGGTALSTIAQAANRMEYYPYTPSRTITADQLSIEVTTLLAATNCRVGLYSSNANGTPNALIVGTADLSCAAVGVVSAVIASTVLTAGTLYYIGVLASSTQTLRGIPLASLLALSSPTSGTAVFTTYRATQTYATGLPAVALSVVLTSAIAPWVRMRHL